MFFEISSIGVMMALKQMPQAIALLTVQNTRIKYESTKN